MQEVFSSNGEESKQLPFTFGSSDSNIKELVSK